MKDTITTFTRIQFSPTNPNPKDIRILDIAHALSFMTRANGHFRSFYSVAQHSISCCQEAKARQYSRKVQLACLLHDASEAYLSDVTRPVKKCLNNYVDIEKRLQDTIYHRYIKEPLTYDEKLQVGFIDDAMLYYEFYHFMEEKLYDKAPSLKHNPDFKFYNFIIVEKQFIELFHDLTDHIYDHLAI